MSVIPYSHWWTSLPYCIKLRNADVVAFNPLKGRPGSRSKEGIVSEELVHAYERDIARFVLDDYDPEKAESISHFALLKNKSQCLFAKTAKLWGSPEWKTNLSFGKVVILIYCGMILFIYRIEYDNYLYPFIKKKQIPILICKDKVVCAYLTYPVYTFHLCIYVLPSFFLQMRTY